MYNKFEILCIFFTLITIRCATFFLTISVKTGGKTGHVDSGGSFTISRATTGSRNLYRNHDRAGLQECDQLNHLSKLVSGS